MSEPTNFNPFSIMMTPSEIAARNLQKRHDCLNWFARYHFSTVLVISALLQIDERNARSLLKKMEGEGLLRSEVLPSGHRTYGLSTTGVAQIHQMAPSLAKIARPYQMGRLPISTLAHHLHTQMAELSLTALGWTDFASERELYTLKSSQVPDLLGFDQNELYTAVEIELTQKSTQRAKIVFKNYAELVGAEVDPCIPFQRVLYLTPFPQRIRALMDDFVPAEKRGLFEADYLYRLPLRLTPRRNRDGGERQG